MARKHDLRKQRTGTVINLTAKRMESRIGVSLKAVEKKLEAEHGVNLVHENRWMLVDIIKRLRKLFPERMSRVLWNLSEHDDGQRKDGRHGTELRWVEPENRQQGCMA